VTLHKRFCNGRNALPLVALLLLLTETICFAQRGYVGKYDAYVGFSNINAPFVNNLNQPGVGVQFGMAHNRWLASGLDYSVQSGTGPLTAGLLTKQLQMGLSAALPPGYNLRLPTDVKIQTFAGGTQLTYRRFARAPIFLHPVLTALRIEATPRPKDPIEAAVAHALVPSGKKVDVTPGFGFGGGTDLRISKHLSARMQMDAAWSHPVNDILANGGWIIRAGVGPSFHFGRDINSRAK
jgi:hypothetical protein